jgi:hypothetical protein
MKITRRSFCRAIPVAGLLLALSGAGVWAATTVAIYPGAHVDAEYNQLGKSDASTRRQQAMGVVTTVYASSDSYDKIYAFYKSRYKPDTTMLDYMVAAFKAHPQPGVAVPRAMFTIDGPSTLTLATFKGRNLISIMQHK